ncbi:glucosamine--fructose-6-phosphate aminotransferase [Mesotoga sp. Brook.08.YT.4.2.5.1]|nr:MULTISPECIES: glutamine--fructose-6-phosphate transaminase (isomerizing) [unclassified Mesotoga]PNE22555.1 glucosamine--fructose-6-phosphate aminotransferase [Mesotoga sp. Brook.08.YT.4.2.5.1]RAO95693.1 glucosamine--fructose-6-phosphate aminotransferase [Mesotoga sp. Brook.08.YT.4.2.5.4.]RDI94059.1 glucosamine--fructose-6-phosphate aminotransferase [Mesotoga sp. Brook.08.YT.4.2.5.2.]
MCGIVGMVGEDLTIRKLVDALKKLEYRGYDSAGVAVNGREGLRVTKAVGRISALEKVLGEELDSNVVQGIAHTRWATHGGPSDFNAHPHTDCTGKIAVVHNGIIENFDVLRIDLEKKGHIFKSVTDTEVIAHLIEDHHSGDIVSAVRHTLVDLEGAYAIGVVHQDHPGVIVAARKGSPLVVGSTGENGYLASDVTPLLKHIRDVYFIEDGELAVIRPGSVSISRLDGTSVKKSSTRITWGEDSAEKGGYDHFMLKEIFEEPQTLRNALMSRIKDGAPRFKEIDHLKEEIAKARSITVLACGTSYHAGLVFQRFIQDYSGIRIEVEVASEFRYRRLPEGFSDLVIAVSQSGETADTLEGIRKAKRLGTRIISLTNVVGSTISRESDAVIYINAGPEIGVAATKTYVAQVAVLLLLGAAISSIIGQSSSDIAKIVNELEGMPTVFENTLPAANEQCKRLAAEYSDFKHFMYMGRGYSYATALEGALKLKEISYIHASGYQAGELKHGPIALLDKDFPVFAIVPEDEMKSKMISNIMETRARDAKVLAICSENDKEVSKTVNSRIEVPRVLDPLYPLVMSPYLQLFAYYIAVKRGLDPDKPRNLAKSVTVE